jgi:hypothetical protein
MWVPKGRPYHAASAARASGHRGSHIEGRAGPPGDRIAARLPGARAYYDPLRARGVGHPALRQLGNGLVGILHGRLTTGTTYDESTAWTHQQQHLQAVA